MSESPTSTQKEACLSSLARTEALISTELGRHLRSRGMSPATFRVLKAIDQAGGNLCPHEIGERLTITRGAVTQLLDTLEEQGLVRRTAHAEDRRMLVVELTDRASELLRELLPDYQAAEEAVLGVLDARERSQLFALLAKIQAGVATRAAGQA